MKCQSSADCLWEQRPGGQSLAAWRTGRIDGLHISAFMSTGGERTLGCIVSVSLKSYLVCGAHC